MGADILGGLWAFEAAITSIAAADFWNPIGWVLAIVAVVVIVVIGIIWVIDNWDEIKAFIVPALDAVGNWWSETSSRIWGHVVDTPVAIPIPESKPITKPIDIPLPITIPIATPIDTTKPSEGGPWNVYDIHIVVPGVYGDYTRGFPDAPTMNMMHPPEIYKYGRTKYASVIRRYEAFQWANDKEAMILENLRNKKFGALEWYATRRSEVQAIFIEKGLISAYYTIMGKYPPANTGKY